MSGNSFEDFDQTMQRVRTYLVDPLTRNFDEFKTEIRSEMIATRKDFRDALEQNAATLRVIADPETGFVPRTEVHMRFERVESNIRWILGTSLTVILTIGVIAATLLGAIHK